LRRQAFDERGRKIDYAIYPTDYVVEYPDEADVPEIAFWNYDQYPYTLYGTVVKKFEDDIIQVKEFGGCSFKTKFVCHEPEAKVIISELNHLEKEYKKALGHIHKEYRIKLAELSERHALPMPNHIFK